MTKKYDLIFSLGAACLCAQMLRRLKLRFNSYPFDWIAGNDFSGRVDFLVSDFKDFLNKEDFVLIAEDNKDERHPCYIYKNEKTEITFPHDFPKDVPFEESFPAVKEKYDRRIARLQNDINRSEKTLIVYTEIPTPDYEEQELSDRYLTDCHERITRRFPNKEIDLLYIFCTKEPSDRTVADHIRKISFDYRQKDYAPPHDALLLRTEIKKKGYGLKRTLRQRIENALFRLKKHLKDRRF